MVPTGCSLPILRAALCSWRRKKPVPLPTRLAYKGTNDQDSSTVAILFISTPDGERNGRALEGQLTPLLVDSLRKYCQDDAGRLIVNVGQVSEHFDFNAYFGGSDTPQYALVYKVYLTTINSFPQIGNRYFKTFQGQAIVDLNSIATVLYRSSDCSYNKNNCLDIKD